jgi:RNA polymerase sigma-70 factor, ECF subfamily
MEAELLARRAEERALLLAAATGDHAAFERVYRRFRPLVEQWVQQYLADRSQVEEVVQDVFLEMWLLADRFDPAHSAFAWIKTIAGRRAIDRARKTRADRERELRIGSRDLVVVDHATVERAESVLDRVEVRRALAVLPERQREAVALRYLVGMSGPEVGARLGIPTATAKTRVRDGLIALRRVVDRAGVAAP